MCSRCTLDELSYIFAQDNFITTEAQKACKTDGRVLAQKLDQKIYIELNKCCSHEHRYRIEFVADDKCNDNTNKKFRWLDEDKCRRPNPLQPSSPTLKCQTVSLLLSSQTGIPQADIDECSTRQRFICQAPTKTATSSQITTAENTSKSLLETTTSTQSWTTTEETTTYKSTVQTSSALPSVSESSSNFTPKQTYSTVQTTATIQSSPNLGLIVGIAVPGLIAVILLVILCLFCHKKKILNMPTTLKWQKIFLGLEEQTERWLKINFIQSTLNFLRV